MARTDELKDRLAKLVGQAKDLEKKFEGKAMPEADAATYDEICTDAEALQKQLESAGKMKSVDDFVGGLKEMVHPTDGDGKKIDIEPEKKEKGPANEIVGYLTLRKAIEVNPAYGKALISGFKGEDAIEFDMPVLTKDGGQAFVPVTRAQIEKKDITITTAGSLIAPDRLTQIIMATEPRQMMIRNLLPKGTTVSDIVQYNRETYTHAAAGVAEQGTKPKSDISTELISDSVKKIAHHMLVTKEMLADAGQMEAIIRTQLLYGLDLQEDNDLVWGDGTGANLLGIMNTPGIVDYDTAIGATRGDASDTLLDKIRRARTNVVTGGFMADGVALHPILWEEIELLKGSTETYIWATAPDGMVPRVWRMPVTETMAMDNPNNAGEYHCLVGGWSLGGLILDRETATLEVGWVNDDFIKNQKRLLAEKRLAFLVWRPAAFIDILGAAAAS